MEDGRRRQKMAREPTPKNSSVLVFFSPSTKIVHITNFYLSLCLSMFTDVI
jgi:hypothetical protein